jgi:hypothetical protein
MRRRYALSVAALLGCTALLAACGGGKAANTPVAVAPTTAPTVATASVAATHPASSATGSLVAATTSPTVAAGSIPAAAGTRPAGSITTGSVTTGTIAAGSVVAGPGETVFTDPQRRFSFARPAAWTVGQSSAPGSVVQFNSARPPGVIDISTESVASGITPDTYLSAALVEIKKGIPDAQQTGTARLRLDSEPAVRIDYTGTVSGNAIAFSQIFALHNGTAYILTLGTQPADSETMKQQAIVVVQTWKFLQ